MLVLVLPRVSSRVSAFPVASPCLLGKLQNLSFSKVSKQVVMSFCVASVALSNITTCLTCRKCQNWRKSRTKCSFFCAHVSRLESLVFLWRRRVYWGSCKTSPFRRFPSRLSCRFAWQAWHFVTFQPVLYRACTPHFTLYTLHSTLYTPHSTLHTLHSTTLYTLRTLHFTHSSLLTPHFTLHTPHFTLHTPHSTLYTPHFTLCTLHSSLHTTLRTPHFTLHTSHSTLYTLHFTLYTPHGVHTPHATLYTHYTPHSTLYTPHSLLYTPHSTLYTFHSTLHTFHSTLQTGNRGNMCKALQDCSNKLLQKSVLRDCMSVCFDMSRHLYH